MKFKANLCDNVYHYPVVIFFFFFSLSLSECETIDS